MTTLTRVASVALLTSSLTGPVYASNVSSPIISQAPQKSVSTIAQTAPATSLSHAENTATSESTSSASRQNTPTTEQTPTTRQKTTNPTQNIPSTTNKNSHTEGTSSSGENAQSSHTAAAAAAANSQSTSSPQTPPVVDTQSFADAGIPSNDEKSWIRIGVRDGRTAASLNHIFEQTTSNPHHKETDNPEFFNNIHPIVDALNDHKFTLGDLSTLIAEHHHQEEEGKAEELGPDLTNIIIDSAAKIHHGASAQETVGEITAQQNAIDTAEKQEQND